MGRLKKHVAASRKNGARSAKKLTKKRVPVFVHGSEVEDGEYVTKCWVDWAPKPAKGYFYKEELCEWTATVLAEKRARVEEQPSTQKDEKAAMARRNKEWKVASTETKKTILRLNEDPAAKVRAMRAVAASKGRPLIE